MDQTDSNGEDEENERNGVRVAGTEGATESCYVFIWMEVGKGVMWEWQSQYYRSWWWIKLLLLFLL